MSVGIPRDLRLPLGLTAAFLVVTLLVPVLPLADPVRMSMETRLAAPSFSHPLGADGFGRDVLSRILWGARTSLSVAFIAAGVAAILGTIVGIFGGFFRGVVEFLTVRVSEVVLCLPPLLLALLVVTLFGPGSGTLVVTLTILFVPAYARVAYSETLSVRTLDYVAAQETLGIHPIVILARTVLPNVLAPLVVQFSLTVAAAIVLESGLSFLGLGVVPPSPSWGLMIRDARSTLEQAPMLLVWPSLVLAATVLLLNMLCDRLRDVLDPRRHAVAVFPALFAAHRPGVGRLLAAGGLLRVEGLTLELTALSGSSPIVRDVSFRVAPGETVALVGESGSGKTLTALALLGLLPPAVRMVAGHLAFTTRAGETLDLALLPEVERRHLRGDEISMVFQDPSSSLDPLRRVGDQIADGILAHRDMSRAAAFTRAVEHLAAVGLPDPERRAGSYPHELSGGQRQRAMIASAIVNGPRLLLADEPTTALDVTIQAQILRLFADLARKSGDMGTIFVTHNLAVVADIADRVCIMYAGEIVEEGPVEAVFAHPHHPYTAALLASVPEGTDEMLVSIPGAVPRPDRFPEGCRFAPRCELATDACRTARIEAVEPAEGRMSRCLRWRDVA